MRSKIRNIYSHTHQRIITPNTIMDRLKNENIFTQDIKYSFDKFMNFAQSQTEEHFDKFHDSIFKTLNISNVPCLYFRFFLIVTIKTNHPYSTFYFYAHFLSFIVTIILLKFWYKKQYLNIILLLLFTWNQLLYCSVWHQTEFIEAKPLNVTILSSELFYNVLMILFLNISLVNYIIIMIPIFFLVYGSYSNCNSTNKFFLIYLPVFTILFNGVIYYYLCRGIRQWWALFDSFKQSYFILNEILEKQQPFPWFIWSKNFDIVYCNQKANEFLTQIKRDSNKIKNFWDVLPKQIQPFFKDYVKKSYEIKGFGRNLLPFSLYLDSNYIDNIEWNELSKKIPFYNNEVANGEMYNWSISKCYWKNQECVTVNCINNKFFPVTKKYGTLISAISEEVDTIIGNVDKLLSLFIKKEETKLIDAKIRPDNRIKTFVKQTSLNQRSVVNKTAGKGSWPRSDIPASSNEKQNPTNFTALSKYWNGISAKPANNTNKPDEDLYDYSMFFFFKHQTEFIFDWLLSKEIYFSVFYQNYPSSIIETESTCDWVALVHYMSDYLYILLKHKNFSLNFEIRAETNPPHYISVQVGLLRLLIFNLIWFIINNSSNDQVEKSIIFCFSLQENKINPNPESKTRLFRSPSITGRKQTQTHQLWEGEDKEFELFSNQTATLSFRWSVVNDKPTIKYSEVIKWINLRKRHDVFDFKEETKKLSAICPKIIIVSYILNIVYNRELFMQSNDMEDIIYGEITCNIVNSLSKKENLIFNSDFTTNELCKNRQYYNTVLKVIYGKEVNEHVSGWINNVTVHQVNKSKTKKKTPQINDGNWKLLLKKWIGYDRVHKELY